jgi:hypothetical protein
MKKITYDLVLSLLDDEDVGIVEQALLIFRVLLMKSQEDIEEVFTHCKIRLLKKVEEKLNSSNNTDILIQSLYILCNIAAGNDKQKSVVFDFIAKVAGHIDSADQRLKTVAILILTNLVSSPEIDKKLNSTWNDILYKLEKVSVEEDIDLENKANALHVITKLKNLKK